jgi:HSP20 family molecular chaperone IbpA
VSVKGFEGSTMEDFFNTSVFGFSTLPEVEIKETPAAYLMEMDVGALREEDIQISLEGNLFTIASLNPARILKRSFVIPPDVEKKRIQKGFGNGMIRMCFPRMQTRAK